MIGAEVIDIASNNSRRSQKMKKLMTLALGLSFLMGTVSLFAQDKPADAPKTDKKAKKAKKAKKPAADTDKK
jgi:hypothetical protein